MKKETLIAAALLGVLLMLPRGASKRARSPASPKRARWREQLDVFAPDRWKARAPAWAVPLVDEAARKTDVPAVLLAALIRTESAWQPYVVSHAGAIGLAQLMPATAAQLGVDPWSPAENVLGGARYLREQLDAFDDVGLALAAYNAGPHRVRRYGGVPPFAETQAYVARILARLAE
jgi:soluble lytic murein transglycosylase-like protein